MKKLIQLEEALLFGLGIYLFSQLGYAWWWFAALLLVPDLSMIGYVFGNKVGAWCYNIAHHRALAIGVYLLGIYLSNEVVQLAGVILFAHSSMDRMFGYGLKLEQGFKFTHLGEIGK
ncbi:DUF4260 domain-containing protein [Flavobacterium sp. AG291]|uniref:DUF4260 domain-containing protein n=1 Tax=Flavobacterium sp. AG291 TaxID=2184000 RepID=UPI000E0B5A7D|nr:DUF4260 domain-containing protein [Flavobacterium sp. AG291]RDI15790.1 uncharacterized protein DUF4260 [Flavobacterium sp. AG291]